MQSIFRLPWCSDQIAPKMSEKLSLDSLPPSPMVDFSGFAQLKRKRTDSNPDASPVARTQPKKPRADAPPQLPLLQTRLPKSASSNPPQPAQPYATPLPTPHETSQHHDSASAFSLPFNSPAVAPVSKKRVAEEDTNMSDAPQVAMADADLTPLQQVIDNQFNMQILMKHNELRLIEQELAKCQIALEQLRRCEVRPYPGFDGPCASVSSGTGPSITPPSGYTRPSHPTPHGVVDGPYTRHYRQWLLHDPQFDTMPLAAAARFESSASAHARSTRNNGINRRPIGKSFSLSSPAGDALPSLPNYPTPAPKDKSAPLVLKRSTDNQLVKLICNNCLRGNFSSIQGFLNHCRIAHKVDYKSHDAAAIDCGRVLDEQEAANLPVETVNAPPPKPSVVSRVSSAAPTPLKNIVHPMNASGGAEPTMKPRESAGRPPKAAIPHRAAGAQSEDSPLTPSSQAPRLSAHFAKFNLGGNLEQAITAAKQKIDYGIDELSPDVNIPDSPAVPKMMGGGRTVAGAANAGSLVPPASNARPVSRKGHREPGQRPRPSPLAPAPPRMHHGEPESPSEHSPIVSPHTADSNPGLVSDHEDDDHGSQSEDETPQVARARGMTHSLGVRRDCTDNMEMDNVAVDDDIDETGVLIRRNSMDAAATRGHGVVKPQGNRN